MDKPHNENPHLYWEQQPDGRWITIDPTCDPRADRDMQDLASLLRTIAKWVKKTEPTKNNSSSDQRQ